jgi:hypothetical protein
MKNNLLKLRPYPLRPMYRSELSIASEALKALEARGEFLNEKEEKLIKEIESKLSWALLCAQNADAGLGLGRAWPARKGGA